MVQPNEIQHESINKCLNFIDTVKKLNESGTKATLLVHCARGRSRSFSLIVIYLMISRNWSLKKAYLEVKKQRPIVGPHYNLKLQLIDYENYLFNRNTLNYYEWARIEQALFDTPYLIDQYLCSVNEKVPEQNNIDIEKHEKPADNMLDAESSDSTDIQV